VTPEQQSDVNACDTAWNLNTRTNYGTLQTFAVNVMNELTTADGLHLVGQRLGGFPQREVRDPRERFPTGARPNALRAC
jgi:hypothetical protein